MPPDFTHFVDAQSSVYATALAELQRGRKQTHWMWFIFPQIAGLGHSAMSRRYALHGLAEARAYLSHPILGPRLRECCQALLAITGKTVREIMGVPDDLKLRSSLTLFSVAAPDDIFVQVLDKYFDGQNDPLTLDRLDSSS
jgi:uncharacterized protein (DUF1810 family)